MVFLEDRVGRIHVGERRYYVVKFDLMCSLLLVLQGSKEAY